MESTFHFQVLVKMENWCLYFIFTARRYASAVRGVVMCSSFRPPVCLSVCHKPALYQNG